MNPWPLVRGGYGLVICPPQMCRGGTSNGSGKRGYLVGGYPSGYQQVSVFIGVLVLFVAVGFTHQTAAIFPSPGPVAKGYQNTILAALLMLHQATVRRP